MNGGAWLCLHCTNSLPRLPPGPGQGRKPERSQNSWNCASLLRKAMFIPSYSFPNLLGQRMIIIRMEGSRRTHTVQCVCLTSEVVYFLLLCSVLSFFTLGRYLHVRQSCSRLQTSGFCWKSASACSRSFSWPRGACGQSEGGRQWSQCV